MENKLGEKIKGRRIEKGLTLTELSQASGVHTTYLGRIERGERSPSAITLRKIASPLGFDERTLLQMAGYLSPDETDERMNQLKERLKGEVKTSMSRLMEQIDSL